MSNNVPKLRFKGFNDEWKEKKLGSLGTFLKGSGISKADLSESGKECILYGELYTKYSEVIKKIYSKTQLEFKGQVLSKANDILIPSSGETAIDIATASCVQKDNILLGGDLNIIRLNNINGVFISYELNSSKRKEISKVAQGASVVHIYNDQLKKILVNIPSIEEQEKIANFLTKVDKIIEKQEEKVSNLESYKKGMMQKIFSQEIRFKDENGGEYPKWEKKNLGNIVTKKTKGGLPEYCDGNGNTLLNNEYLEKVNVEPTYVTNDNNVNKEDVLILWDGSQAGKVYTGVIGVLGSTFVSIKLNNENSNLFIYQMLNYQKDFIQNAWREGSGVPHVAKDFIENFKVVVPCLEEQTKIANLLSNIDLILDKEKEKLAELRLWKKGLLQQMFV